MHQKTVGVRVESFPDSVQICVKPDTTKWYNTPAFISVPRSSADLEIIAVNDSLRKDVNISSQLSGTFWLGNLFCGLGLIGYAVDLTNDKRYTYPSYITIDMRPGKSAYGSYRKWWPVEKGLVILKISIPEGNHLYLNKGKGYGNTFGFLGLSGGLDYYFTDKYCLNMDLGVLTDFMIPVPAPVDYVGLYERSFAAYGDIQLGSDYKHWHYDAGLQYNRTSFYERETLELFPEYIDSLRYSKIQHNLGASFSCCYRISNGFNLALNYYPSFLNWDASGMSSHYSHLLFFELSFRIEAIRP
jgi:hypothetical protein